jgi:LacI family transcriptional regulator
MRKRVNETVKSLGYALPNGSSPKHCTVALICAAHMHADGTRTRLCRALAAGVRSSVVKVGGHLTILTANGRCAEDHFFTQSVEAGEVNGVILLGIDPADGYLDFLLGQGLPIVAVNRESEAKRFSSLSVDGFGGGRQAADYLVSLGHERIACCADTRLWHVAIRQQGVIEALSAHGLKPAYLADLNVRHADEDFREGCARILDSGATAVIFGDWGGARCVDTLTSLGADIPRALSLVDFDDMELITTAGLRVTSVGYDKDWMGRAAGRMLLQLVEEQRHVRQTTMTVCTHIVEHDTTAPPSK